MSAAADISIRKGHDGACYTRAEDHLNRWPVAVEIYRIAAEGPEDWSVRIGVYGEWGSGKSSVLNFVESIATDNSHIVVRFNPWQFRSKDVLWKSFVDSVFTKVEEALGNAPPGKVGHLAKKTGSAITVILPKVVSLWREDAGKAVAGGLDLLKRYLCSSAKDLAELKSALMGRRLIITIDDLDRTDGQLVPEILFALKEVMDVPGMAFVCAFDPVVVGKVLGSAHPGHEDGLKFLDKIIDYPRWLAAPTVEQLSRLAVAEAQRICPFVPADDLREVILLLPRNPRTVRQFIRLLDLLRPQILRHHPHEIHWPILLAANAMKVVYPQYSHHILEDTDFWDAIYKTGLFGDQKQGEQRSLIKNKVDSTVASMEGMSISGLVEEFEACIRAVAKHFSAWMGIDPERLHYQFHIAEAPHAVTWKEFEDFVASQQMRPSRNSILSWVKSHENVVDRSSSDILSELLDAALQARKKALGKAADQTSEREMAPCLDEAAILLKTIEILVLDLAHSGGKHLRIQPRQIRQLFHDFAYYFHWRRTASQRRARKAEEHLLKTLFASSGEAIHPWIDIIGLTRDGLGENSSNEWINIIGKFRSELKQRCAKWLIKECSSQLEIRKRVFHDKDHGYQYTELFFDLNGPVWTTQRKSLLHAFSQKSDNTASRRNAYDLLSWLVYLVRQGGSDSQSAKALLSQADFAQCLWRACVAEPLNPRAVGSLRDAHAYLLDSGIDCRAPAWWNRIVDGLPQPSSA